MIVRERAGSYVLIRQHDHALASGQFARHWAAKPRPLESTLYAVAHHDVAWRGPDAVVRWNEETGRPYSFLDYPVEQKVRAYAEGIDWLEERDRYAALLCSRHYETLVRQFGKSGAEEGFAEAEQRRQKRLRAGMSGEQLDNLDRNLRLLKLCDGLSLYLCLNEGGGGDYPPPYPGGFRMDGKVYNPVWEDQRTLRLEPGPFDEPFHVSVPYEEAGKDRHYVDTGQESSG
jgi:hypothetical protein